MFFSHFVQNCSSVRFSFCLFIDFIVYYTCYCLYEHAVSSLLILFCVSLKISCHLSIKSSIHLLVDNPILFFKLFTYCWSFLPFFYIFSQDTPTFSPSFFLHRITIYTVKFIRKKSIEKSYDITYFTIHSSLLRVRSLLNLEREHTSEISMK